MSYLIHTGLEAGIRYEFLTLQEPKYDRCDVDTEELTRVYVFQSLRALDCNFLFAVL